MSIVTDADVIAYVQACGQTISAALSALVSLARTNAERGMQDYLGYLIERQTVEEFLPYGTGNTRGDGDGSSGGFDLSPGGQVVARSVGRGQRRELVLTQLPVRSVTTVYDNPAAWNTAGGLWPASSLLTGNAYYLDAPRTGAYCWSGILYRNVGSWSLTPRAVKLTYEAGLTPTELTTTFPQFRLAVLTASAIALGKILARGRVALTGHVVSSVSIEDFAASFSGVGGASLASADGVGLSGVDFPTECRSMVSKWRHPAWLA